MCRSAQVQRAATQVMRRLWLNPLTELLKGSDSRLRSQLCTYAVRRPDGGRCNVWGGSGACVAQV